jgi:5'-3' exonuclease
MLRHLKKITVPDALFVSYIVQWMKKQDGLQFECAPFEAEWQLIHLERQGVVNYVYTTDGDSIILGADRVITDIDFK